MIRRITALLGLAFTLLIMNAPLLKAYALPSDYISKADTNWIIEDYGEANKTEKPTEPEKEGYWKLIETTTEGSEQWEDSQNMNAWGDCMGPNCYSHTTKVAPGSFDYTWKCIYDIHPVEVMDPFHVTGETGSSSVNYSLPPQYIIYGDTVNIDVNAVGTYTPQKQPLADIDVPTGFSMEVSIEYWYENSTSPSHDNKGSFSYPAPDGSKRYYSVQTTKEETTISEVFSYTFDYFPPSYMYDVYMYIKASSRNAMKCTYKYEWIEGEIPDEVLHASSYVHAGTTPGDDGGVYIPPAIVVGTSAVAAYLGAVGGRNKKKKSKWVGTLYKLHIRKNFGNKLKPYETMTMYAWIEAVKGSTRSNSATETARITAYCPDKGVQVSTRGMTANGMQIDICVTSDYREEKPITVSVVYHGTAGSTYTRNVIFEFGGEMRIKFVRKDNYELEYWDNGSMKGNAVCEMLSSDKMVEMYFRLDEFREDVPGTSSIKVEINSDYTRSVSHKLERVAPFVYRFTITNNDTSPMPVFEKIQQSIMILLSTEEPVYKKFVFGEIDIYLYPEGIHIPKEHTHAKNYVNNIIVETENHDEIKGECLVFQTNKLESNYTERSAKLLPTAFPVCCVFRNSKGEIEIASKNIVRSDSLKTRQNDKIAEGMLRTKFFSPKIKGDERSSKYSSEKGFELLTNRSIYMKDEKELFLFAIGLSYKAENGTLYSDDMWFRAIGEQQTGVSKQREVIIKQIRRLITIFELDKVESPKKLLQNINEIPLDVLMLYKYAIYDCGSLYQLCIYKENTEWANYMDKCIFAIESGQFIFDLVLAGALIYAYGTVGAIATPLVLAIKSFVYDTAGEAYTSSVQGTEFKINWSKASELAEGVLVDTSIALLTGGSDALVAKGYTNAKKLTKIIAAAAVAYNITKNAYLANEEYKKNGANPLFTCVKGITKDATVNTLKFVISQKIGKILKEPNSAEAIDKVQVIECQKQIQKELRSLWASKRWDFIRNAKTDFNEYTRLTDNVREAIHEFDALLNQQTAFYKTALADWGKERVNDFTTQFVMFTGENGIKYTTGESDKLEIGFGDGFCMEVAPGAKITVDYERAAALYSSRIIDRLPGIQELMILEHAGDKYTDELKYIRGDDMKKIFERFKLAAEERRYSEIPSDDPATISATWIRNLLG